MCSQIQHGQFVYELAVAVATSTRSMQERANRTALQQSVRGELKAVFFRGVGNSKLGKGCVGEFLEGVGRGKLGQIGSRYVVGMYEITRN